jgi:subtilisin family serine protease
MRNILLIILSFLLTQCNVNKPFLSVKVNYLKPKSSDKNWQNKDIIKDSIPGISLDRAYQELLKNKIGKQVIVAVIDAQMDIHHEDLKQAIWVNKDEIPNNGIDDDKNGYVDDVNGWNFIGNTKGESVYESHFEFIRVIKKFKDIFENKSFDSVNNQLKTEYILYKKAKKRVQKEYKRMAYIKSAMDYSINWLDSIKNILKPYFPDEKYTIKKLKSYQTKDKKLKSAINRMIIAIRRDWSIKFFKKRIKDLDRYNDFYLNLNYNDRDLVGDDVNDVKDVKYGYHNVLVNPKFKVYHATYMAGVIGAIRNNNIGLDVFSNQIKIMPLVVSSNGDENDKDIALAIRYAVDNGAKVINMSFIKDFSMHQKWVQDALIYAEKHQVLCVHGSGNDHLDNDTFTNYPVDYDNFGFEIVDNFIEVGSNAYHANKWLISSFSNYGIKNVDIFAPGQNIYTTNINDGYTYDDGTSMAVPMVTGIAALIWSYYPNLKAKQVKEIILASGVSYDLDVEITGEDGKKKLVPFNSLSKSGKIVNAYNALLFAKNYKKWKAGKWPKK